MRYIYYYTCNILMYYWYRGYRGTHDYIRVYHMPMYFVIGASSGPLRGY